MELIVREANIFKCLLPSVLLVNKKAWPIITVSWGEGLVVEEAEQLHVGHGPSPRLRRLRVGVYG